MARTAAPERLNPFLTRCNLEPSTRLHEVAEPAFSRPELSFRIAIDELLGLIGEAVTRIGGTGLTRPCARCGPPSWRSRLRWRAILGSEWPPMISMPPQRRLSLTRAVAQRRWISGAGGCSRRQMRACAPGLARLNPARCWASTDPQSFPGSRACYP